MSNIEYDKTKHLIKRLSIDFDGTICENKKPGETYKDVKPKPGAIEALKEFKAQGFDIVIHTARNMATCNNNVAKATAIQGPIIHQWCLDYDCPYDELLFGKPHVDFIIDDKAIEFKNWKDTKKVLYKKIGDIQNG
tara:strand:+ start:11021 stop:11428 length:408 start_codon:yes stop_codon:yes gene_type:complete